MKLLGIWRIAGAKSVWHLLVLMFAGCSWVETAPLTQSVRLSSALRSVEIGLPEAYAAYRSQLLSSIDYQIEIDLTKPDYYIGLIKIKFSLKEAKDLTIDFTNGEVDEIRLNGFSKTPDYNKYFIHLKKQDLSVGTNLVEIKYRHLYGKHEGLIRFIDPKDKKVYMFTNFGKYGANHVWPCFDQPDLFATIELVVKSPKDWQVISSSPQSTADYSGGVFYWLFPRFQKINIHSLTLAAGYFHSWQKNINTSHPVSLRIWTRQSIAKNVLFDDWFLATKNGLIFYEKEFDKLFSSSKYDQVLVPAEVRSTTGGFTSTFLSEGELLSTQEPLYLQKRKLTQITLEKLAHHWFGQNIILESWNDFWMSQSFARYISYEAMERGTLYKDAGRMLLLKKYIDDQENIEKIFFWKWLKNNISDFSIRLHQFMKIFYQSTISSRQFFNFWGGMFKFSHKNHNRLQLSYDCSNEKPENFTLKSENVEMDFQFSKVKISIFRFDGPRIVEMKSVIVDFKPPVMRIEEFDDLKCANIAFILIDPQNQSFLKWKIDMRSLKNLKDNIEKIEDENIRFYAEVLLQESQKP